MLPGMIKEKEIIAISTPKKYKQKFLEVQKPFYKKVSGRQGHRLINSNYLSCPWDNHIIVAVAL